MDNEKVKVFPRKLVTKGGETNGFSKGDAELRDFLVACVSTKLFACLFFRCGRGLRIFGSF